jgi:hypothetical protein
VDTVTHHSQVTPRAAALAVAVPLVAVLAVLTLLQRRIGFRAPGLNATIAVGLVAIVSLAFAAAVLDLGLCVLLMAAVLAALVAVSLIRAVRAGGRSG